MPRSLYFPYMHRRLEHFLTQAVTRIAYPDAWEEDGKTYSGNTRHILGFILSQPTQDPKVGLIMHYLYTRRDYSGEGSGEIMACYRRQGIAQKLLDSMMRDYEQKHITFTVWGQELWKDDEFFYRYIDDWVKKATYNPELFMSTLLPHQWEKGVNAAKNADWAEAFHSSRSMSPTPVLR